MTFVYLGLFQKILDWVFGKILEPIVRWLGGILNSIFTWIVNEVVLPMLENIIMPILEKVFQMVYTALAGLIYRFFAQCLVFLDSLNGVFDCFIGMANVTLNDGSGTPKKMMLLDIFFTNTAVSKVFWYMTFIGFILCMMFAIYGVAKSAFDLDFEGKKPVSRVLSLTMRAMLHMFSMQFFIYFLVRLAGAVLLSIKNAVDYSLPGGVSPSLGGIIFAISSLNAGKDGVPNLPDARVDDKYRGPFYKGIKSVTDIDAVKQDFAFEKFDYLVGFICVIFLIIIMAACLMVFMRRLFDMLILYLASPYFVAMFPLDDGERFGKWREQFLGKAFSGYGMVVSMKLYILLVPMIMDGGIIFSAEQGGKPSSPEFDYIVKLLFLIGGAWAILKSGPMITSLISEAAGQQEEKSAATGAGMATFALGAAGGYVLDHIGPGGGGKNQPQGGGGGLPPGAQTANVGGGKGGQGGQGAAGGKFAGKPANNVGGKKPSIAAAGKKPSIGSPAKAGGSLASADSGSAASAGGEKDQQFFAKHQGRLEKSYLGFIKKYSYKSTGKDGKPVERSAYGVNLGILGKWGATEKGVGGSFLGFSYRTGADGRTASISIPGLHFRQGQDGKMHFDRLNISPIGLKVSADSQTGTAQLNKLGMFGLSREKNANGDYQWTGGLGLWKKTMQDDGKFHNTSFLGGLYSQSYGVDENGKLSRTNVNVAGFNLYHSNPSDEDNKFE